MLNADRIEERLRRLDACSPQKWISVYNETLAWVRSVGGPTPDALSETAIALLSVVRPDISDEWKICLVLQGLLFKDANAVAVLAQTALSRENSRLKTEYIRILDGVESDEATSILESMLKGPAEDDLDDSSRVEIIRSLGLRANSKAVESIALYVDAQADKVRRAAIRYLFERDARETSAMFIAKLPSEDDIDVLRLLVDALVKWDAREALAPLREVLASSWAQNDPDISTILSEGVTKLTAAGV